MIFEHNPNEVKYMDEEDEEEVNPREHYQELVEDTSKVLKRVKITPNDNFPEFLWTPVQNDFTEDNIPDNHNYIDIGLGKIDIGTDQEIVESIRGLRNRYKDYFQYLDALEVWYRYYDYIEQYFGSFDIFMELVQSGETVIPFKRKPKLKSAKKNKYLVNLTVPISRINREDGLTDTQIAELASEMPDQLDVYEDYYEYSNYLAKFNASEERRLAREYRMRNYRRTKSTGNTDADLLCKYINTIESSSSRNAGMYNKPLSDDLDIAHEYDEYNEDVREYLLGLNMNRKIYIDPNYQIFREIGNEKNQNEIDLYTAMYEAGYDISTFAKNSSTDRKAVKMITKQIMQNDPNISAKKAKKLKKKRLKAEKKLNDVLYANEEVRNILTKNKVSFDPEENMLSFTMKDLMS